MDQEKVGNLIKEIRKNNKMTQQQFADKYGVTYQAVSNWEHGKNLPDVSLLKQISVDFNISIDELLDGKNKNMQVKNKKNIILIFLILIIIFLFLISLLLFKNYQNNNFEFKTISSNCQEFNIWGSVAYNTKKTSIYINNVNYCGGDDKTEYQKIECVLYEVDVDTEKRISSCNYINKQPIKLEDYLKNVEFKVADYSRSCKVYSNETLYLRINATDKNNKTITYKIPLKLNDTCGN